jgi:hypothetical protein
MMDEEKLAKFGPGPWMTEPDRVEYKAEGFPVLLLRHEELGNWCGYLAVQPGNPLHGLDHRDVSGDLWVHGGVNYASQCSERVCHVPDPGEPDDVWWFGFDAGHGFDMSPGLMRLGSPLREMLWGEYRDLEYIKASVEGLAAQIKVLSESKQYARVLEARKRNRCSQCGELPVAETEPAAYAEEPTDVVIRLKPSCDCAAAAQ